MFTDSYLKYGMSWFMKEESTHIQTMIHKRQLKTRRFLVLSGFYVLMYMNLDEKANYSSERTGKCILYTEKIMSAVAEE